jgi:hypothetical protein
MSFRVERSIAKNPDVTEAQDAMLYTEWQINNFNILLEVFIQKKAGQTTGFFFDLHYFTIA